MATVFRAASEATTLVVSCRAGGGIGLERRPRPVPGAGEALLELICCGLCGTDLFKLAHGTASAGVVLGHELVGRVVEVGPGVDTFDVGDRVVVPHHVACGSCALCAAGADTQCPTFKENLLDPGGFSELVLVRRRALERAARRVPEGVTDEAASFMEPTACVLRGVDRAGLDASSRTVVVMGAGSMGLLHLLVLRALAPRLGVVLVDPLPERCRLALSLGAAAAAPPDEAALAAALAGRAAIGADAVFDTVGGAAPLRLGLGALRPGGTAVLFAHAGAGEAAGFELNPFFKAEQRVVGTYSGGLDEQRRAAAMLFNGRLDPLPLVTHRMPLESFEEAVALVRSRQALKVMLRPAG